MKIAVPNNFYHVNYFKKNRIFKSENFNRKELRQKHFFSLNFYLALKNLKWRFWRHWLFIKTNTNLAKCYFNNIMPHVTLLNYTKIYFYGFIIYLHLYIFKSVYILWNMMKQFSKHLPQFRKWETIEGCQIVELLTISKTSFQLRRTTIICRLEKWTIKILQIKLHYNLIVSSQNSKHNPSLGENR